MVIRVAARAEPDVAVLAPVGDAAGQRRTQVERHRVGAAGVEADVAQHHARQILQHPIEMRFVGQVEGEEEIVVGHPAAIL
jgi:hypothetical protein